MTELLTVAQMRSLEGAAIASGAVTGLELMERAGRGVVEAIFAEWPKLRGSSHRAVVLCGPGNNGGDGFVVARLLKQIGWDVELFHCGNPAKLPHDARVNLDRWKSIGSILPVETDVLEAWIAAAEPATDKTDCILIDALFGTGLVRPIAEPVASVLNLFDDSMDMYVSRYIAIDTPSGLCADSGKALARRPRKADLTVTFHRAKIGHYLDKGPYFAGRLAIVDIGLTRGIPRRQDRVTLVDGPHPLIMKRDKDHKFAYGHALVIAGGIASGGAARLAARAALRIGAGLVTLGCPPSALMVNAAHLNAVMLKPIEDASVLVAALQDERINALCLGPGMGADHGVLVAAVLDQSRFALRPTVLDADALTILSRDPKVFAMLHDHCILTPHAGEFARLFPDIAAKLAEPATTGPAYSKVDATREAAKRAGCVVLFKGPDTVIAAPDGRCSLHAAVYDRTAPWLATAGSGDVLAGFITGLLARGFSAFDAACTGAWLHVECARSYGPGLIAEDLPEELPKVFRAMGL